VTVELRPVEPSDLPVFFEHQADLGAAAMVGMPSRDREAFDAHWARILADPTGLIRTVLEDGAVAGNMLSFLRDDVREVGYWLGRSYWGRGIATAALQAFLRIETRRPLHAGVTRGNGGSVRVLEKCGFVVTGGDDEMLGLTLV
jgi:RimJ/RimL family protein N-acetyltransferase